MVESTYTSLRLVYSELTWSIIVCIALKDTACQLLQKSISTVLVYRFSTNRAQRISWVSWGDHEGLQAHLWVIIYHRTTSLVPRAFDHTSFYERNWIRLFSIGMPLDFTIPEAVHVVLISLIHHDIMDVKWATWSAKIFIDLFCNVHGEGQT